MRRVMTVAPALPERLGSSGLDAGVPGLLLAIANHADEPGCTAGTNGQGQWVAAFGQRQSTTGHLSFSGFLRVALFCLIAWRAERYATSALGLRSPCSTSCCRTASVGGGASVFAASRVQLCTQAVLEFSETS